MLTELKKLAGDFSDRPLIRGREIRDLLEHSPEDFCAAAVEVLTGEDSERVKRFLVALLWTNNLLISCLTNPSTPPQRAEAIAALAKRVDPQLPAKLVGFVLEHTEDESAECIERVLGLLKSMPDAASFRPLLTPLLRHPNARIRAKAALLAGEGNHNRTWFERRMLEDDPRVRANAIESADTAVAADLHSVFRAAVSDPNNRVVGNALIALYRLGDADAVASLHELASSPEPTFRATAVWAMGETGDTRFLPVLGRILTDPNETIKSATFRAIRKLRGGNSVQAQPVSVRVLGEPYLCESSLKVVFGVSDGCNPILGIAATAVRILANGEPVYRYSVTEQECRRRISAAFLLPWPGRQKQDRLETYREALERCFAQRQKGDGWTVAQHSGPATAGPSVRPETLFGVKIDGAETSSTSTIANLSELRAALAYRETIKCQDFTGSFLKLCQELRLSRVSSHLLLVEPESAQPFDAAQLTSAAQEAHVSVHAVCSKADAGIREMGKATGGFYAVGEDISEILPALYRGISHRYEATLASGVDIRRVQVGVRSAVSFGESPLVEMSG